MDQILLESHNATLDYFSIPSPKNDDFKLHLQESALIK